MDGDFSTTPAKVWKLIARMWDSALLLTISVLYPALPRNRVEKCVVENALTMLKFWLVKGPGCTGSLSSANQQHSKRHLFFYVTATADQSAASFEMEMSQTGFSAHYSQVCWPPVNDMSFLFQENKRYFKNIKFLFFFFFFWGFLSQNQYPGIIITSAIWGSWLERLYSPWWHF